MYNFSIASRTLLVSALSFLPFDLVEVFFDGFLVGSVVEC